LAGGANLKLGQGVATLAMLDGLHSIHQGSRQQLGALWVVLQQVVSHA
jgi:hypothetical protein